MAYAGHIWEQKLDCITDFFNRHMIAPHSKVLSSKGKQRLLYLLVKVLLLKLPPTRNFQYISSYSQNMMRYSTFSHLIWCPLWTKTRKNKGTGFVTRKYLSLCKGHLIYEDSLGFSNISWAVWWTSRCDSGMSQVISNWAGRYSLSVVNFCSPPLGVHFSL